jgi:hypothetical protein
VQLLDSLLLEERKRMLAAAHQQQQLMLQQRSEAAMSNVRSQPGLAGAQEGGAGGDSSFRNVAHRASLALSDPNGNHSTSPSTATHPSPAGLNPPPAFQLSPDAALTSGLAFDEPSALTQSMLDQILFSGMGAPLGGAETVEGTQGVDFWGMMAGGGGGGGEFGAGWVGEEGFGGF